MWHLAHPWSDFNPGTITRPVHKENSIWLSLPRPLNSTPNSAKSSLGSDRWVRSSMSSNSTADSPTHRDYGGRTCERRRGDSLPGMPVPWFTRFVLWDNSGSHSRMSRHVSRGEFEIGGGMVRLETRWTMDATLRFQWIQYLPRARDEPLPSCGERWLSLTPLPKNPLRNRLPQCPL